MTYPEETPFYVHHMKLWTVLHQVCAVFLRAGVSEIGLSRVVSGLLGMLSLQALAMFTFAFSGRAAGALGVALLLFVSGVTNAGALYPIFLMGVPFTYGVVGLSLIVLVAASYGSGLQRFSAFLLGFAPAVHTGLAVWLWVIAGGCLLIERGRSVPRGAIRWLSAGAAAAGVSYAVHAVMSSGVPGQPVAMDRHYLDAFTAFWDGHRRPVAPGELAVLLNGAGLVVSTVWLRTFRAEVSAEAALLLRFTQVAAAVSLALVPVTWVPPDRVPVPLLVLMPGRVLNIVAMTFPALVLGLCGSSRAAWPLAMMALMSGALLLGGESMFWRLFAGGRPGWVPAIPTHAIAFVAAGGLLVGASAARWRPRSAPAGAPHPPRLLILALRMAAITVIAAAAVVAYRVPERRAHIFIDRTNSVALAAAAAGPGLLLTVGDAHLMQLRTRRPMLVDTGALDTIPYTPGSGPVLYRILRDIYGIDLFNPPEDLRGAGRLLEKVHRQEWERYTAAKWRDIRRTYHVTQVLTPADWQLDLPIVAGDRRYLLYAIPE